MVVDGGWTREYENRRTMMMKDFCRFGVGFFCIDVGMFLRLGIRWVFFEFYLVFEGIEG